MERAYAATLGPIALIVTLVRGWFQGGGVESVLLTGWMALWIFTGLGFLAGWLAQTIVESAIRERFAAELAATDAERARKTNATNSAT